MISKYIAKQDFGEKEVYKAGNRLISMRAGRVYITAIKRSKARNRNYSDFMTVQTFADYNPKEMDLPTDTADEVEKILLSAI